MKAAKVRARLALALFAAQFVLLDLVLRRSEGAFGAGWLARAAVSFLLWTSLARLATTRGRRAAVATFAAATAVLTTLVFRYYHAPLDARIVASALAAFRDVRPVLARAAPEAALVTAVLAAVELSLLRAATQRSVRRAPPRLVSGLASRLGPVCAVGCAVPFLGNDARATPDLRAFHALSGLRPRPEAERAGPEPLLPLPSARDALPDVLFVVTESVRASDYTPERSRRTRGVLAARAEAVVELAALRSVASYTALSLSAILTGRVQDGDRTALRKAPTLFTVARAVRDRSGQRMRIAYVAGQSETVFETDEAKRLADRFVTVETLLGHDVEDDSDYTRVPIDRLTVERLAQELGAMEGPRFVVLHLVSTHAPYFVDPADAPEAPWAHVVTWSGLAALHAAYANAIVAQDASIARAIEAFVDRAGPRPWVIVFTSDHGEAFGEHGAIHHGQNLYDEQIRVPGFVASGNGGLSAAALAALRESATTETTHLDLVPTVLDALGVLDRDELGSLRAELGGRSLLRRGAGPDVVPMTNCTAMFPCPVETWGMSARGRKVAAQPWDRALVCTSTEGTHELVVSPPDARCAALLQRACARFPQLPNGEPCR